MHLLVTNAVLAAAATEAEAAAARMAERCILNCRCVRDLRLSVVSATDGGEGWIQSRIAGFYREMTAAEVWKSQKRTSCGLLTLAMIFRGSILNLLGSGESCKRSVLYPIATDILQVEKYFGMAEKRQKRQCTLIT